MPDVFTASRRTAGPKKRLGFDRVTEKIGRKPKVVKTKRKKRKKRLGGMRKFLAGLKRIESPFVAYAKFPKVKFETQGRKEEVVLLLRGHWATNVSWVVISLLGVFAPLFWPLLPLAEFLPVRFQIVGLLGWYLLLCGFVFEKFMYWYFNVFIVTNSRVVDIDFHSLLYKEVSDAELDWIEDVTYRMGGIVRAFLNYGDIYIQTAAERAEFEFHAVPKPGKVVEVIQQLLKSQRR